MDSYTRVRVRGISLYNALRFTRGEAPDVSRVFMCVGVDEGTDHSSTRSTGLEGGPVGRGNRIRLGYLGIPATMVECTRGARNPY